MNYIIICLIIINRKWTYSCVSIVSGDRDQSLSESVVVGKVGGQLSLDKDGSVQVPVDGDCHQTGVTLAGDAIVVGSNA